MPLEQLSQVPKFAALIAAGRLHLGMTRAEVRATLGDPDALGVTSRKYRTPACFKYGEVQLFFGPHAPDGLARVYWEAADGEEHLTLPWPEEDPGA